VLLRMYLGPVRSYWDEEQLEEEGEEGWWTLNWLKRWVGRIVFTFWGLENRWTCWSWILR